jgi:hypothetical protein
VIIAHPLWLAKPKSAFDFQAESSDEAFSLDFTPLRAYMKLT